MGGGGGGSSVPVSTSSTNSLPGPTVNQHGLSEDIDHPGGGGGGGGGLYRGLRDCPDICVSLVLAVARLCQI